MSNIELSNIELLLATADEHRPALEEGLPLDAVYGARQPKKAPNGDDSPHLDGPGADPNDLRKQRWGVIVPRGREGAAMLEAITPLLRLRESEQGAPVTRYEVEPDMDAALAVDWKNNTYRAEDVATADRPRYLLLLGELDEVTLELQHTLANGSYVGRLSFTDGAGEPDLARYEAYARKVVGFARNPSAEAAPDALFYTASDDTSATAAGRLQLVSPCIEMATRGQSRGTFPAAGIREIPAESGAASDFLRGAGSARPSVLLSVSHGLGAPRGGWKSSELQRRRQGALSLGREVLEGEALQQGAFLPGGMWFCLACFGAGTPATSAFYAWLAALAAQGAYEGRLDAVLKSLPGQGGNGGRPFVAALPQAALANPEGPLAVIGHMDLAWTHGFTEANNPSRSRASRIHSTLEALVEGARAGVALDALMLAYRETNDALTRSYEAETNARAFKQPDPTDPKERANDWMLRNDLRGYVLLGDPAARLPLAGTGVEKPVVAAPEINSRTAARDPDTALARLLARPFSLVIDGPVDEDQTVRGGLGALLAGELIKAGDPDERNLPLSLLAERYALRFGQKHLDIKFENAFFTWWRRPETSIAPLVLALASSLRPGIHVSLLWLPLLEQAVAQCQPDRTVHSVLLPVVPGEDPCVTTRVAGHGDVWSQPRALPENFELANDIVILRLAGGGLPNSVHTAPLLTEDNYIDAFIGVDGNKPLDPRLSPFLDLLAKRPSLFLGISLFDRHHRIILRWLYSRRPIPDGSIAFLDPDIDAAEQEVWQAGRGVPGRGPVAAVAGRLEDLARWLGDSSVLKGRSP
jgi:hypothetical protein